MVKPWRSHTFSLDLEYLTYKMTSLVFLCPRNSCAFGTHSCHGNIPKMCFYWTDVQVWKEVDEMNFRFGKIWSFDFYWPYPSSLNFQCLRQQGKPVSLFNTKELFLILMKNNKKKIEEFRYVFIIYLHA